MNDCKMNDLVNYISRIFLVGLICCAQSVFTQPCSGGVELVTSNLRSDQFSASSFYGDQYKPESVRLNNGSGWIASYGGDYHFLKIDLEGVWNITRIEVSGATNGWYTRKLRIFYSDDDLVWNAYSSHLANDLLGEKISANQRYNEVKNISLNPTIKARFIVFNPVNYVGYASLRLEIHGCRLSTTTDIYSTLIDKDIEVAQTWIPSQSPIVINKQITIRPSGSLNIQAGVAVIFTSFDAGIEVFGNLSSTGVAGVPVLFSGSHPLTYSRSKWNGLKKNSGGRVILQDTVVRQASFGISGGGKGISIKQAVIHSCDVGIQLSEGVEDPSISTLVQDTQISYNREGILLHGSKAAPYITIHRGNMSSNDYDGLSIVNWDNIVANAETITVLIVTESSFERNQQYGFRTDVDLPINVSINNCTFIAQTQYSIYFYRYYSHNKWQTIFNISYTRFLDNAREGIYLYSTSVGPLRLSIYNNNFQKNVQRAMYLNIYTADENDTVVEIHNNTFSKHSYSYYPVEIQQRYRRFVLDIHNNIFIENQGAVDVTASDEMTVAITNNVFQTISGPLKSVIRVSGALLEFTNNLMENSTTETVLEIDGGYDHTIENNSFISTEAASCFVNVKSPFHIDKVISMSDNYWGTDNVSKIKEKICDFFINVNVARIKMTSIYLNSAMSTRHGILYEDTFVDPPTFFNGSYILAGLLNYTLIPTVEKTAVVLVNRSILIDEAGYLEIAGVNIIFAENRGIIVKGQLVLGNENSSADSTVLKSVVSGKKWGGIYLYGGHLSVARTNVSNLNTAITIKSTKNVIVKMASVTDVDNFISAQYLNGNLTISIESSQFELGGKTVFVELNDTERLTIQVLNSSVTGQCRDGVIRIGDASGRPTDKLAILTVQIENSTVDTEYYNSQSVYVYSCYVHFRFLSSMSRFSSPSEIVYSYVQSGSFDVSQCHFLQGSRAFSLQFCNKVFENEGLDRNISVYNNTFELSSSSQHIYYYNWHRTEIPHRIYIHDNFMKQVQNGKGEGFYFYSINYKNVKFPGHDVIISDTIFSGYRTAVNVNGYARTLNIIENIFVNNSEVFVLDQTGSYIDYVNFSSNLVKNNEADGIVRLIPYYPDSDNKTRISFTHNAFENNMNTVITITAPNVLMKYNFFENRNATFNLKVTQGANVIEKSDRQMNASLNYWGSSDVKSISTKIYDLNYDQTLFDIVFRPYLGSRNLSDIQNEEPGFISSNGDIGGTLRETISLGADNSPYLVTSNIEIQGEGKLILDAGVTLLFKAALGISVSGSLFASGNMTHPVRLLSYLYEDKWRGIEFESTNGTGSSVLRNVVVNNTLHGIIINSMPSELTNTVSNYSKEHGFVFNIVRNEIPKLISSFGLTTSEYNSSVKAAKVVSLMAANNSKSGVHFKLDGKVTQNIDLQINECALYGNNEHGAHIEANATITLKGCNIIDNRLSGVYVSQNFGGRTHLESSVLALNREYAVNSYVTDGIVIDSCNVTQHNFGYYYGRNNYWYTRSYIRIVRTSARMLDIVLKSNRFVENTADGILFSLDWSSRGEYSLTVENNLFQSGNRSLVVADNSYSATNNIGRILLYNNKFDNLSNSISEILKFDLRSYSDLIISKNNITDINAKNIIVIEGERDIRSGNITIHDNIVTDNYVTASISVTSYQNNISLTRNIFRNSKSVCELEAPEFITSTYAIDAILNYWGDQLSSKVVEKVCSFEKNMTRSFVYYVPYYIDESFLESVSLDQDSFSVDGALGGEVTKELFLTKANSPYIIDRSFMVRRNASVIAEEGIVLHFKKDRGIYVNGNMKLAGKTNGTLILQGLDEEKWFGVVLNSLANASASLMFTNVIDTKNGIVTLSPYFSISSCNITNSSGTGLSITINNDIVTYDFEGTNIENSGRKGLLLNGNGGLTLSNLTVQNSSEHGIYLSTSTGSLFLNDITIRNSTTAVEVFFSASNDGGNVSIENCKIVNNSNGVILKTQNYYRENMIRLSKNYFLNNTGMTLHVVAPSYEYRYVYHNYERYVDIGYNIFENSSDIRLQTYNVMNLSFHDNTIKGASKLTEVNKCILDVFVRANTDLPNRKFDISTNIFERNRGTCVMFLDGYDYTFNGTVFYNKLLGNNVEESVVKINTRHFSLSENIFDNADSPFDVYVTKLGNDSIQASNNWWGSANPSLATYRVFDYYDDTTRLSVNITPILTEQTFDCSTVQNCSDHGECVRPNGCRCFSGWAGPVCADYDCAGVGDCYANGVCIGPNACKCNNGWTGDQCIYATCLNVNNCSGHGFCIRPDVCKCAENFRGSDCGSCEPFHWGLECKLCPACQHGACDLETGLCKCDGNNWAGFLCDRCNSTFYGPNCLPLMTVLSIVPNQGIDQGNTPVHVWGHNFPQTSDKVYFCKFGNIVVNGTWEAWNHVVCRSPAQQEGDVLLEISPNKTVYTSNRLIYTYYATCPPGACGRDKNPPRGQCLFGSCSCNLPWTGDGCTVELYAPEIESPPYHVTVAESSLYTQNLTLKKGSPPVRWTLVKSPQDMTIDVRTGLVEWLYAKASLVQYEIRAQASNIVGSHVVAWNILVHRSYSVVVTRVEPSGTLVIPKAVTIYGEVTFANGSRPRVVPIDVRVKSMHTGRTTTIAELTNPLQPTTWTAHYYPRADDVGQFVAFAFHPAEIESNFTVIWSVAGMRCEPSSVYAEKLIEEGTAVLQNISTLSNVGGSDLTSITSEISGLSDAFIRISGSDNQSSQPFVKSLGANESVSFDLVVTNARPLSGTIFIIFTTSEGTRTTLRVSIRLSIRLPLLRFTPSSLTENVIRGSQRIIDVELKNEGEVTATNIRADLPIDSRLSLVSFSTLNQTSDVQGDLTLSPGETAVISLAVTAADATLGEMSGTIAVNSDLTYATLSYRFYITSVQQLNLTFLVKDEYTYFAAGAPLVSGAEVRLSNPRRGYSETRFTTNETGYVIFENITEDQYTLYARADGHTSYSAVIIADPKETNREIFLQRVAVRYTWTVTPTTIEDKYIITLDSTFETSVPMPVVTIEPAKVNTIPYELGQADTIEFTITNHGLIRADNLRFALPLNHPYLIFQSTIETIGSIDANTTLIIPVRTTLKKVTKRNAAAAAICGLALLYDYVCGGTQTRGLDVTLTREYPGRPPLPCGSGGGGSGGGSGGGWGGGVSYTGGGASGSGSSMTYNPVTPLSCDCAKTLIKSCVLAYHPVAGCAIAVTDLGTCVSRSGGDAILTALNCILGVADTAMACVFGNICSLCGAFYTTIRCIIDVSNCDASRRRREVSSGVVDNMIKTAQPMDNFLQMMADIFGDEDMYNLNRTWYDSFKIVISDSSASGTLLTSDETTTVLSSLADDQAKSTLSKFLIRWNNTAAAWKNGTLTEMADADEVIPVSKLAPRIEQYLNDIESSKQMGFASIFDDFFHATNEYKEAEKQNQGSGKDDGVCAKVRVRIVQELVLTRDAFNARLEIENGENSALENIEVEIVITQTYGTGEPANSAFSIGAPSLIGISAVDGTGRLGTDLSGSAEWLMIPYSHAAPQDDTQYDVGGRLSYRVGGSDFSVPLLPDTITVKPNPSLIVHYFHEKYVRGDDPMTTEIERIVPFTLAVMVMNAGFGVARALKITSAQPEIIENEKGLLITFKIIGSQIGNRPITPSLAVNFGDIESFQTKTAQWLLTSSLKGTFYNYSATFENINPLGDPQLSLLDELGYHELVHVVQIQDGPVASSNIDDGLGDFLVNDQVDENDIPEFLYNSANGTDVQPVLTANVTAFSLLETLVLSTKTYKVVQLKVVVNASAWSYTRVVNNITSSDPADDEHLLQVAREDERNILVEKNAWQTTHIFETFLYHMLDFSPSSESQSIEVSYNLTFGPRNMYSPKFNATQYTGFVSIRAPKYTFVLKLDAYDIDKDFVSFKLSNSSFNLFYVKPTGEIEVKESLTKVGKIVFDVIVEDSGIPAKSSSVTVSVLVTEQGFTTPVISTTVSSTVAAGSVKSSTEFTRNFETSTLTTMSTSQTSSVPIGNLTTSPSTLMSDNISYSSVSESSKDTPPSVTGSTASQPAGTISTESSIMTSSTPTGTSTTSVRTTFSSETITSSEGPLTSPTTQTSTMSTTPVNGTRDKQEGDVPQWVIPTAVGASVGLLLLVFITALIYALRRNKLAKTPAVRSDSYTFNSRR